VEGGGSLTVCEFFQDTIPDNASNFAISDPEHQEGEGFHRRGEIFFCVLFLWWKVARELREVRVERTARASRGSYLQISKQ
jgi:hypothetical protein